MKFIFLVGVFALAFVFGCNNPPPPEQTKVVERETVKVVEVKPEPVKVVVEEEKGTSVKIGPDGATLKTKKVDIDINK
jgi:hypothetical protein